MTDIAEWEAHYRGFVRFVAPDRRGRFRALWKTHRWPKTHHFNEFDLAYAEPVTGPEAWAEAIEAELRRRGAGDDCFVFPSDPPVRTRLRDALEEEVGAMGGTFVSCIAGELGYFENEAGRWMLHRPRRAA